MFKHNCSYKLPTQITCHALLIGFIFTLFCTGSVFCQGRAIEIEREKQLNKIQFSQNFKSIQLNSQALLKEHESGELNGERLGKVTRAINKSAKTLRMLIALGSLADEPTAFNKDLNNQATFDKAIRQLHQLIYDFAHSPVHQNSKVFNTKAATKAQVELLTIIELSKAIESQSRIYVQSPPIKPSGTN